MKARKKKKAAEKGENCWKKKEKKLKNRNYTAVRKKKKENLREGIKRNDPQGLLKLIKELLIAEEI